MEVVTLTGRKSFQDAKSVWKNIRRSTEEHALTSVLIIDTSTSELNAVEVINLEQWLTEISFSRNVKVAIVDARDYDHTQNWFGRTVAFNRGWYNISVFSDEESARKWLLG